jgi:raffinose/stachyose/melibiose transport system permease protein
MATSGDVTRAAPATVATRATRRRKPFPVFAYLCILPAFLFAAVFMYYPSLSAVYHSFFDWDGATAPTFVGLANFQQMFSDDMMRLSWGNVLKLTLFALVVELTVPLAVAKGILALRSTRLQHFLRVLFLLPLTVPLVVNVLIWQFLYDPNIGLINAVLTALHQNGLRQDWLGDPNWALYAIMFMGFPWVDGFGMLIYTAGLQAVPQEVLESASLDGAGAWTRFWRMELPLILGQLRLMSVLTLIAGIQNYVIVLIMTDGGPGFATYVPGLTLYKNAFYYNKMGYACSIGTSIFLLIMVLTVINLRYIRPSTEYDVASSVA